MYKGNLSFKIYNEEQLLNMKFGYVPLRSVHLFLPTSIDFIEDYKEILLSEENDYFLIKNIPSTAFIEETFLKKFLKKGSLVAITNTENEMDNFMCITESGKLILSLENGIADYLSLHKEKLLQKEIKTHTAYVIQINHQDFVPCNKYYDSVAVELKKIDHIKFNVLLKWKPEGNICCGSIREYFESQNYECVTYEPLHQKEVNFSVEIPKVNFPCMTPSLAENVLEWFGLHVCDIKKSEMCLEKLCIFDDTEVIKRCHTVSCQGFYSFEDIQNLLKKVRSFFIKDSKMPFVAVLCGGYQHCYVDNKISKRVTFSDRIIFILISPQNKHWVITMNV